MEVNIGKNTVGDGNKEKIHLRNYERSSHDLGYIWRSSMGVGTLVPFMTEVALPGDTFDIDVDTDIMTLPTLGPLFGSMKVQLDFYQIPIRLFQGKLHMNKLGIGMKMSDVLLPQLKITAEKFNKAKAINKGLDNYQINSSSIFSYLNIRGLGTKGDLLREIATREFNAIPYLAYWSIYKNYYANKQEEVGAVIHNDLKNTNLDGVLVDYCIKDTSFDEDYSSEERLGQTPSVFWYSGFPYIRFNGTQEELAKINFEDLKIYAGADGRDDGNINQPPTTQPQMVKYRFLDMWTEPIWNNNSVTFRYNYEWGYYQNNMPLWINSSWRWITKPFIEDPKSEGIEPKIKMFPLDNIDNMREDLLMAVRETTAFKIDKDTYEPYGLPFHYEDIGGELQFSAQSSLEGLALKTYQSDLFNNWVNTEWLDGENGVNDITKIDTTDGGFTIDEFLLNKKIYDMLNRIAISGGSYDDWLDATYTHERTKSIQNPIYLGGLSKELSFQEVVSNSASEGEPLGTLAGRGRLTDKHKGGKVYVKIDEPSYIMGLISITPRIDYSQGNKWDTNLKTMDDFHKPQLDGIGFQELITDQMAWWDTELPSNTAEPVFKSAGKQPAWINYMTNVNQVRGTFADEQGMWMTLNRRYEPDWDYYTNSTTIKDLTTYIDPVKYNHIFADPRRDSQNYWTQIKLDITARRKMSAKMMPNL